MTHKKTFQIGGIHLDKHKISALNPIIDAGVPELVYIPVRQHIGAPAVPLVAKGDRVLMGQKIAELPPPTVSFPLTFTLPLPEKSLKLKKCREAAAIRN